MSPKVLTLETTVQTKSVDITTGIPQTTLYLVGYRVDLLAVPSVPYRELGIQLGNVIGSSFVIDNISGSFLFRIPLDQPQAVTLGADQLTVTFVQGTNIPLTMSGDLPKQFEISVFYVDRTVTPNIFKPIVSADFKYMSLTFRTD